MMGVMIKMYRKMQKMKQRTPIYTGLRYHDPVGDPDSNDFDMGSLDLGAAV